MSAQSLTQAQPCLDSLDAAREHVVSRALTPSSTGTVGLELEFHLVDSRRPDSRVGWSRLMDLLGALRPLPAGSKVTVEPGGQVELSTPPYDGVGAAVRALELDVAALTDVLAGEGLLLAALGADPARAVRRINPGDRYVAMEQHFAALGATEPGMAMMCATAALQVNLDAGPASGWAARVGLSAPPGPGAGGDLGLLTAGGRQGLGVAVDAPAGLGAASTGRGAGRCSTAASRRHSWARYALVRASDARPRPRTGSMSPVTRRVPFAAWVTGAAPLAERRPTAADLDLPPHHAVPAGAAARLPRDALPRRRARRGGGRRLAGLVTTLLDDPRPRPSPAEACRAGYRRLEHRRPRRAAATRSSRRAAARCAEVAAARCPHDLRRRGRAPTPNWSTPAGARATSCAKRAAQTGPLAVLEEEAHA